jgi:flagellar hook-basal body complex protein FliE
VFLKKSNQRHINLEGFTPSNPDRAVPNFAEALNRAMSNVNDLQHTAQKLQVDMVTQPEKVNPHEVAIAQTKAELSLSFTKAISSRMVNAFKDLQNLR